MFDLQLVQLVNELTAIAISENTFDVGVNEIKNRNLTASGLGACDPLTYDLEGRGLADDVGLPPNSVQEFGAKPLVGEMDFRLKLFGEGYVNRVDLSWEQGQQESEQVH